MTIAELLAASRAAHEQYKVNLPRMTPTGIGGVIASVGDQLEARRNLLIAIQLRREAEDQDPTFADPAWDAEPVPHAEMAAYYALVAK